jgi:hypothetical protein
MGFQMMVLILTLGFQGGLRNQSPHSKQTQDPLGLRTRKHNQR